jgi:shikimate kinase
VGELLERAGEARFRDLEAAALRRLLEPSPELVLATGGGVVERADNRTWLARTARCVFLSVPLELLAERLRADPSPRPPLVGGELLAELAELRARREPHYRTLAEIALECGDAAPSEIAARIRAALEPSAGAPRSGQIPA